MKTKQTLVPLKICKSPAYEMNPAPISYFETLISSYDPQTDLGKKIYSAFMNYDKKCSQAKIDLIDKDHKDFFEGRKLLEKGDLQSVADQAVKISNALAPYVEKNIPIISIIPSCSLMLKSEWPSLLPKNEQVQRLSKQVMDISEYVIHLHKKIISPQWMIFLWIIKK